MKKLCALLIVLICIGCGGELSYTDIKPIENIERFDHLYISFMEHSQTWHVSIKIDYFDTGMTCTGNDVVLRVAIIKAMTKAIRLSNCIEGGD